MATSVLSDRENENGTGDHPAVSEDESEPDGRYKLRPPPIDASGGGSIGGGPRTPGGARDKGKKIGHRRVDETGLVTYKKKPTSELMAAIQLGIGSSVGSLSSKPERDVLMQDFQVVDSVFFPAEGSNLTPAHSFSDFRFKTYAPIAFRYFRELFGIHADDFLVSLSNESLKELSNPGASGSIFYLTADDEFIIKTVQHKEAEFLQKLLPGYYMNLNQNPRTLLPKFYGLYCYQCGGKNIRFCVMNNLLPSSVKLHEKYDLKGSTHKRKASKNERAKSSPTLKDLDFLDLHPEGILLEKDKYDALMKTIQRDCRVLESFKIMDYSLLLGIYNLDIAAKEAGRSTHQSNAQESNLNSSMTSGSVPQPGASSIPSDALADSYPGAVPTPAKTGSSLARTKSMKTRLAQFSTAIESIQARSSYSEEEEEDDDIPPGGIPAKNAKGERLLLYMGIIDVLQSYRFKKKLEHTMKSIVIDGDTISVHRPSYYSQRFQTFFEKRIFRKLQTPLKHSPSKRKTPATRKPNSQSESDPTTEILRQTNVEKSQRTISFTDETNPKIPGTIGGRPDLLPENSTPPPTFAEAIASSNGPAHRQSEAGDSVGEGRRLETQVSGTFQITHAESSTSSHISPGVRTSPPLSIAESTPTHTDYTEGTPSYTPSSPSCYSDIDQAFQAELDKDTHPSPVSLSPARSKVMVVNNSSTETSFASALEQQPYDSNERGPSMQACDDKIVSDPQGHIDTSSRSTEERSQTLDSQSLHVTNSETKVVASPSQKKRVRFKSEVECEPVYSGSSDNLEETHL